jgi:acetyl-CoA synthetase
MIMLTTLPGIATMKPGSAGVAFPGIEAAIINDGGERLETGAGYLAITRPWPAMLRGIYGDPERYWEQYWSKWSDGTYFTADAAKRGADGYFTLLGRVDDVLNVAGHRIGTMEVESALVDHPAVAEAAVVGVSDELKGTAIVAFVTLRVGTEPSLDLEMDLKEHVVATIGAIARPQRISVTGDLPKTRSGKIMRRLLRDIAEGRILGDTTTLADDSVVQVLKAHYEEEDEA